MSTKKRKKLTEAEEIRLAAKEQAWRRGLLRWKLDSSQQEVYDAIKKTSGGSFYFNKARRIGGSYLCCVIALEVCLRKPHAKVKYAAPTAKNVRKIIKPNIRKILEDAPSDCKPTWINLEQEWRFPNGSTLEVAGCDNQQYENLRGTEADAIFMDEVGFMDELDYVLNDVLMPQVQDTGGTIVLCSTPPRSPSHPSFGIATSHKTSGRYIQKTVWDNPRRTKEQHETFFRQMAEAKGMELDEFYATTTFRREYLGEFIADSERAVIPEWNNVTESLVCKEFISLPIRDKYTSLDIGFADGMGALFAEYGKESGRLYIIDEFLERKQTTSTVASKLIYHETKWFNATRPKIRLCDNNSPQFVADMAERGLPFVTVKKKPGGKEVMISKLRDAIRLGFIVIHTRCKKLRAQLGTLMWNAAHTEFERDEMGHGDLVDALIYLVWTVRPNGVATDLIDSKDVDIYNQFARDRSTRSNADTKLARAISPLSEWFYQDGGDA